VVFGSAYNVPFLPTVYSIVAALGLSSGFGLFIGKKWAWMTTVIQAVIAVTYSILPLYFDLYRVNVLSIVSTENPGSSIWISVVFLLVTNAGILLLATRRPIKEFLGTQQAMQLPRRAKISGVLAVLCGLVEMLAGFAPSEPGLAFFAGGLLIVLGGVTVLMRKYIVGGVVILVFSLFPAPFYLVGRLLFVGDLASSLMFVISSLSAFILAATPFAAALLAFLSRSRPKKNEELLT
jgi:hypothetical protein